MRFRRRRSRFRKGRRVFGRRFNRRRGRRLRIGYRM